MNINVNLYDSDCVEIEQKDIDNMWNYLMDDQDNFIYEVTQYLENLDFEEFERELRPLYEKLKEYYEED